MLGMAGRPSIFKGKENGDRVQGYISQAGSKKFEDARRRLAVLAQWSVKAVSDADTIEYLARGDDETRKYLAAR